MGCSPALLALFAAMLVFAPLALAVAALRNSRRQAAALRLLEARVDELTLELRSRGSAPSHGEATAARPVAAPAAPAAVALPAEAAAPQPPAAAPPRPAEPAGAPAAAAPTPATAPPSTAGPAAAPVFARAAGAPQPAAQRVSEAAIGSAVPPAAAGGAAPSRPPAPPAAPAGTPAPAAARPPAAGPVAAPPSGPPPARVDWEQWLGLRGAAVVGGIVLALAVVLLLKYSIEQGYFPPAVRVTLAMVAGTASLAFSEVLRGRGYPPTANALAGAGVVILYAASWAAHSLYGLLGALPAFGLMALVTVAAGLLAWRHRALVIAALGLAGGFAAPLMLGTHQDHPLGLFGYLLLLDAGLLALARRRGWPVLAAVALAATALYELRWLTVEMDAPRLLLGLGIVAVFGAVFAAWGSGSRSPAEAERPAGDGWQLTRAGGVLLPAAFALLFAGRADLGPHLWPVAAMIALLGLAAGWLDRRGEGWRLAPAVAGAAVVTVAVWALRTGYAAEQAWELTAIAVGLALVFRLPAELGRRRTRSSMHPDGDEDGDGDAGEAEVTAAADPAISADAIAAGGLLLVLALAPVFRAVLAATFASLAVALESGPPPAALAAWLTGLLALGALLWHIAAEPGRQGFHFLSAAGVGLGLASASAAGAGGSDIRRAVAAGLAVAAAYSVLAVLRHRRGLREPAEWAAIVATGLPLLALLVAPARYELSVEWTMGAALLFGLLGLLAATRLPTGLGYAGIAASLLLVQAAATTGYAVAGPVPEPLAPLALLAAGALLCTLWPALAGRALADRRAAWIAAALAQPAWFGPLYYWWERAFGLDAIALLPLAQGAAALGAAVAARRLWPQGSDRRRSALAWFGAVAIGFAALAVPLQLDREWITVAWALQGAAVIALWRRLDHPGLRLFGLALLAAVTVRLVANPLLLTYHEASGSFLWSWLSYTYLVPAGALLLAARWVRQPPAATLTAGAGAGRRDELGPRAAAGCGLAAVAVLFVWLNLAIFDAFSQPGGPIQVSIERQPARDLTMSLAWVVFALALLGLGMARARGGLRKVGLGFLILTLCKVFLYDLGELEDLYRVASLVGLAISLLLVSLAYQRFVRGRERPEDDAGAGAPRSEPAPSEPANGEPEPDERDG